MDTPSQVLQRLQQQELALEQELIQAKAQEQELITNITYCQTVEMTDRMNESIDNFRYDSENVEEFADKMFVQFVFNTGPNVDTTWRGNRDNHGARWMLIMKFWCDCHRFYLRSWFDTTLQGNGLLKPVRISIESDQQYNLLGFKLFHVKKTKF